MPLSIISMVLLFLYNFCFKDKEKRLKNEEEQRYPKGY